MSAESPAVTIRPAHESDAAALRRLAALDSAAVPAAPVLLAEVDGRIVAAVGVDTAEAVADPFEPTSDVLELLAMRAQRLRIHADRRSLRRRLRHRRTAATPRAA